MQRCKSLILARPERFELPTAWFVAGYVLRRFAKIFRTLRRANVPFVFRDSLHKCLSGRYAPRLSGTAKRAFPSLLLALSLPAHAATLYARAAAGLDLNPSVEAYQWDGVVMARWRYLKPGPLGDVALGLESRPLFVELHHVSSMSDGFKGQGLTWLAVGVKVDIWSSR